MAKNKNSFVLYTDLIHTVSKLPNETAGILFKHILSYVNDEDPQTDDLIIELAFEPVKQSLKRDLKKWERKSESAIERGRIGGLKSAEKRKQNQPIASNLKQNQANQHVSVSVNVSDSVIVNDIIQGAWLDFLDMRVKKKKPATERAKQLLLEKLEKLSGGNQHEAVKILEQSTVNAWTDLYELKKQTGTAKQSKTEQLRDAYQETRELLGLTKLQ